MKLEVLQTQLNEMERYIQYKDEHTPAVSIAPVGWHLAHNLKVINSIISGLEHSEPADYRKSFSWKKELVYFFGKIPRGKARAPKRVVPEGNISEAELQEKISTVKSRIERIDKLSENAFFEHPYFGHIKKNETPKFLVIHTEHHLKIIRDILGDKTK